MKIEVGDEVRRVSDDMPGVVVRVGTSDAAWWESLTPAQQRANARNAQKVRVRWLLRGEQWLSRRTHGKHWRVVRREEGPKT